MQARGPKCATATAYPAVAHQATASLARRAAALSPATLRRSESAPGAGPLPATCRGPYSLPRRAPNALPLPHQAPYHAVAFARRSAPARGLPAGHPSQLSFGWRGQYPAHDAGQSLPVRGIFGQLLAAASGNRVVLRLAVVVCGAPL